MSLAPEKQQSKIKILFAQLKGRIRSYGYKKCQNYNNDWYALIWTNQNENSWPNLENWYPHFNPHWKNEKSLFPFPHEIIRQMKSWPGFSSLLTFWKAKLQNLRKTSFNIGRNRKNHCCCWGHSGIMSSPQFILRIQDHMTLPNEKFSFLTTSLPFLYCFTSLNHSFVARMVKYKIVQVQL